MATHTASRAHAITLAPPLEELGLSRDTISHGLGYGSTPPPPDVLAELDDILSALPERCEVRCGYRIISAEELSVFPDRIHCGATEFLTGPIIAKRVRQAETLAVYATTAGTPLDVWSHELFQSGNHLKGYLVDSTGSEIAELTADWLEKRLAADVAVRDWRISNRYSPGYCDWNVSEQHKLFSLLPDNFCGITLTASALMLPKKSTSGIIGLGRKVKREEYQCSICDMKDCFRRKE
ncbi:MAG: hypothetical protein NTV54_10675 [Ignavibacteriales bacterium]|nr:hypothetical protein [Ignavibacteriales bacterium]